MELQALLVLGGVVVAGAAVLLLVGLFSASGTSYEEAVAQQRRAASELLALAESKNKPKKNVKKANKKLAKKEKKESTAGSDHESEAPAESGADEEAPARPHVEFTAPVVVDVPRDNVPNVKIRKRGKDPKVKPILLNKEDPSCVSDPSAPPTPAASNHFEEIHPKDDFELLQSSLVGDKAAEKKEEVVIEKKEAKKEKAVKAKTGARVVEALPKAEPERERRNSGDQPKEQRKAKKPEKKSPIEEAIEVAREEIVPPLTVAPPSELTTDKLLKQALPPAPAATPPPKAKKNKNKEPNVMTLLSGDAAVNVESLVRLISEAALSRSETQLLTDTLLNKQHDALQHADWTEGPNDPMQKLKKQLADKEKALADEQDASQALHAKLKELRTSLNAERSRATAAARAAEEAAAELAASQARLQRLADEKHQDKMLLQAKLNAEAEAQAQRVQMEMHIQRLSESETALVAQLNALQAELNARALEAGQARCEAAAARDAMLGAQQLAADTAQQLQEANRVCAELDVARQSALHGEAAAQQELRALQETLHGVSELQAEVQRLTTRAQTAESNAEKLKTEAEKLKEENDKQKQQLSLEVAALREAAAAREAEIAELKQMKAAPAQNGLPPSNLTDQHKAAELAKVEGVIESLRAELTAAQRGCSEQREQAAALRAQLQAYQDKNNELRTKNWKVMEALQSAEKALQSKPASAMPAQDSLRDALTKAQEAQYSEVAAILKSACPTVAPSTAPGRAWLDAFAASLKKELEAKKVTSSPVSTQKDDAKLEEMRAQNQHLQGLVDKYKTIIDDTEGVLSRLQHNVTAEERRWAQQLAEQQRELDHVRSRTVAQDPLEFAYACIEKTLPTIVAELQNKIDSLEAELRKAQAANHNNSFADAERLTQERLLGGLSDKHKLNSSNGPLQVDLEEK
ncbi:ribosome-binding protein 1 isoform X2 [Plutella xylostella]|uniref:ribosome-binding protein 1 isoform X1 n=1 Tax=Plutella xylostella TaxID=51655 RepID=UPI00203293F2|nr:ribosome-binding protein 1 isoform X1 [Plutella xylostella]XP_048486244.1 ribosome-binding protein 1 isoform X2 [Plutella xylostella]XP_048486245.1 ribosome-binding protein 1 isoform X2 [Plutella xylostella]XP_048486246.1 ribosome-binding protein 1 isoform X2 [Plutella xylostella]